MIKENFFLGAPVVFKAGVSIYPPSVQEVVCNPKYSIFKQILSYSQEEIEDIYVEEGQTENYLTPFEFLLNNCYNDEQYRLICKQAFQFFIKTDVEFLYQEKKILIGNMGEVLSSLQSLDELIFITEEEFFSFQNVIRAATNQKMIDPPNPNEHPKVKAMKAKARYRDRVKAKQAAKNGLDFFTVMTSICCMGLGITPLNIGEISYVALEAILAQYQDKEKYQIDINSLLAGADAKKIKPKYWIRNLEE